MRTVAYIGNFNVDFSTESHVALALESLGAKVYRYQEDRVDWHALPSLAEVVHADFVLWTHTHGYADESKHDECQRYIEAMSDIGIPTVGYHLDKWWDLEREFQVYEPFFLQDIVCTADGGHQERWEEIGVNHIWFPPAVTHTEVGRGIPQSRYTKDVGFLGGWMNYGHKGVWPWRYEMVLALNKRYSSRFRAWPRNNVAIRGWEINALYASVKVMAGDSCLAGNAHHYWSDRVPETLGRGGFLVHPEVDGLRDEFPIDLPWTYTAGDAGSLIETIDRALALDQDERDFMIDQAIEFVRERHTYKARMERLFQVVDDFKENR